MNIYERLTQDHETQRELCEQVGDTSGDTAERRRLWERLRKELEAHANAEEQTFYAEMIAKPDGQEKARHSVAEHKDMADLIEELEGKEMDSPGWLVTFKQLAHDVIHHVDEEEEEIFVCAREVISDSRADELVAEFDERKQVERTEV